MILVEPRGDVALITLDRAHKRNALTPVMLASLCGALDRATCAGAIVLLGAGETFCAGFDLDLCRGSSDGSVMRELLEALSRAIVTLRSAACPVVAGVQGAAIAGGCALLGGADVVISEPRARFGYPVLRLGVSPAVSGPFMASALGTGPARCRLLDTALVDAQEAARLGMVHELVSDAGRVSERALAVAGALALKPRRAMAMTKRWLDDTAGEEARIVDAALKASLNLAGSEEEQTRLHGLCASMGHETGSRQNRPSEKNPPGPFGATHAD